MKRITLKSAISAIEEKGALLVFPVNNAKEPPSIWSYFYPKTKMVWDWDDAPDGVVGLWHLREELSSSGDVIYCKWYQGRAMFFSKEVFSAWASLVHDGLDPIRQLDRNGANLYELIEEDSPKSTKQLKKEMRERYGTPGKEVDKAFKILWSQMLIVGFGEVDDGSFPSLCVGATSLMFESAWKDKDALSPRMAEDVLDKYGLKSSKFFKQLQRLKSARASRAEKAPKGEITFEQLNSLK